jgi:hypothetical protein
VRYKGQEITILDQENQLSTSKRAKIGCLKQKGPEVESSLFQKPAVWVSQRLKYIKFAANHQIPCAKPAYTGDITKRRRAENEQKKDDNQEVTGSTLNINILFGMVQERGCTQMQVVDFHHSSRVRVSAEEGNLQLSKG